MRQTSVGARIKLPPLHGIASYLMFEPRDRRRQPGAVGSQTGQLMVKDQGYAQMAVIGRQGMVRPLSQMCIELVQPLTQAAGGLGAREVIEEHQPDIPIGDRRVGDREVPHQEPPE